MPKGRRKRQKAGRPRPKREKKRKKDEARPKRKRGQKLLKLFGRNIKAIVLQQAKDKPDEFASSKNEGTFVLEAIDLFKFEVIVASKLRVAPSERIGSFYEVVAEITVTGLDEISDIAVKITGLVFVPDDAGVFGEGSMVVEAVDVADFGDDAGRVDKADTLDGSDGVRNERELFFDGFVEGFDRFLECSDVGDGNGDDLIDGIIEGFGEVVGDFSGRLDSFGDGGGVGEMIAAFLGDKRGEFVDVHVGEFIDGFELFEDSHRSGAGLVGKNFFLGEAGELHKKIVSEPLLLAGEVLNSEKTCAG